LQDTRYPSPSRPEVLAVFGPTAVGKSELVHETARAIGGEVVVADPFQRYRGLEVAADAPSAHERAEVPYHFVGDLDLAEGSSAGEYGALAHAEIDAVGARGRVPIVAGGTGLYLRAAIAQLAFPKEVPTAVRAAAEAQVAEDPDGARARLRELDPVASGRVDVRNPRRLARALELALAGMPEGDRPVDRLWTATTRRPTLLVAVLRPREVLDARIAARVDRELADGLIAEIEAVLARGDRHRAVDQIIGVREVTAMRAGTLAADDLAAALAARTRRLARRQLAWLRRLPGVRTIELGEEPANAALPRLLGWWEGDGL
jgi:tRNA dimethylallyltransferase